jgi:hypothetical protein
VEVEGHDWGEVDDRFSVERIWERNAKGRKKEWRENGGLTRVKRIKDVSGRKRWLVAGIVRRRREGER